jgi:tetratricopeptide (TPR) repeat protein
MPTPVYREACLHELALGLALSRGRRWLCVLRSASDQELRGWVAAVSRHVSAEDRPTLRSLPRAPQSWPEVLAARGPVALSGLETLLETRTASFAESSPLMKGAALQRVLDARESPRVLLLLTDDKLPALRPVLGDMLARADAHFALDVVLPLPDGARLRPLAPQSPGGRAVDGALRERVQAQRQLLAQAQRSSLAHSAEYWKVMGYLGRLEILLGELAPAGQHLGAAALQAVDASARAAAFEAVGDLALARGDAREAASAYQKSYHHAKRAGDGPRRDSALLRLGEVSALLGNYEDALRYYELARDPNAPPPEEGGAARLETAIESERARLARAQEQGDLPEQAHASAGLGRTLSLAGRHDEAAEHLALAAAVFGELGDARAQAAVLQETGLALARSGELSRAIDLHDEALATLGRDVEAIGARVGQAPPESLLGKGAGAVAGARYATHALPRAVLLRAIAQLRAEQGDHEEAERFRSLAEQLMASLEGKPPSP